MSINSYVSIVLTPREKTELAAMVDAAFRQQESKFEKGSLAHELNRLIRVETGNLEVKPEEGK